MRLLSLSSAKTSLKRLEGKDQLSDFGFDHRRIRVDGIKKICVYERKRIRMDGA